MRNLLLWMLTFTILSCESGRKVASTSSNSLVPTIIQKDTLQIKQSEVRRGQGLFQALKGVDISNALALRVINLLRDQVEFSTLKVGDKLKATFSEKKDLISFSFSQNPAEEHILTFNSETQKYEYSFKEAPTAWSFRTLEGVLRKGSTLEDDLIAQGLPRKTVAEVINVLLCKVNFRMNARMGDRYKVLLKEREYKEDIISTKVLYTSYSGVRAGTSEAYYFEDDTAGSTYNAHYTEDGQALILSGLRYPLPRMHVRSSYGYRTHPVTGRRRMHRGIDLRGKTGAKVHAVASGKVILSTYNKYAGNKIAIRHRDGSRSYYYHLNKKLVKKGQWVKSYQVIGKVGSTGRVTGPHLHFGFKRSNGRWMNPLNKRMIATPKLAGDKLRRLKEQISWSRSVIDRIEISRIARYIVPGIPNKLVEENFLDVLTASTEEIFSFQDGESQERI